MKNSKYIIKTTITNCTYENLEEHNAELSIHGNKAIWYKRDTGTVFESLEEAKAAYKKFAKIADKDIEDRFGEEGEKIERVNTQVVIEGFVNL